MHRHYAPTVQNLRFILYAVIIYLTGFSFDSAVTESTRNGTHFCGVIDCLPDKQHSAPYRHRRYARSFAANLNAGEPRTVRMIYFLPNDRPYSADVVQKMKDDIRAVQNFFAEQMEAHGYGRRTFRVETNFQGEPIVHRVDGQYPDSHYLDDINVVHAEVIEMFNYSANIYLTVVDNSIDYFIGIGNGVLAGGVGGRIGKQGGTAYVNEDAIWNIIAHELGHSFGLGHDFRDGTYIMSYGVYRGLWTVNDRLSECSAASLSVHPYFNPNIPVENGSLPTIELVSPRTYPAGAQSVPVRLKISDSEGLHQVVLSTVDNRRLVKATGNKTSVKAHRELGGKQEAVIAFDYDGVLPSVHELSYGIGTSLLNPLVHPIRVKAIDIEGNVDNAFFVLFSETVQPLRKISGDNQHGLPDRSLPVPFVVEVWDLNEGSQVRGIPITFSVTAGNGRLRIEHTETDDYGRAANTLTLGQNLGTITVTVSAAGIEQTVIFTAVAGNPVEIPDPNLRASVEDALGKAPGTLIAPADIASLTELSAPRSNISDLTGLGYAINLTDLNLRDNNISDLTPLAGFTNLSRLNLISNNITDISPLAGLPILLELWLGHNAISDISVVSSLNNLILLHLGGKLISDISPLVGLTNLRFLYLVSTNITDISPVTGLPNLIELSCRSSNVTDISVVSRLTNLQLLTFWNTNITDISPVTGLVNLRALILTGNTISDLSPLVANTGLGRGNRSGDYIAVRENPLSYVSIYTHIPVLQGRGARVQFDSRKVQDLVKISGDNQWGAVKEALADPFVVEARDENGAVFAEIPVLFAVTAGSGTLSVTSTTTDENGRAESTLTLGQNPGTNTVTVSVTVTQERQTFTAEGIRIPNKLEIISGDDQEGAPGEALEQPFGVEVRDQFDKPLPGAQVAFTVTAGGGTVQPEIVTTDENGRAESTLTLGPNPGTNTVMVSVLGIQGHQTFSAEGILSVKMPMFALSIPAGTHAIHIPLKVSQINGEDGTIETVGDLYDALGDAVSFIISYIGGQPVIYLGDESAGTVADALIKDDTGLVVVMKEPKTLKLMGDALGTAGTSQINLLSGNNLVGVPLQPAAELSMISDLLVDGVGAIAVSKADGVGFHTIREPGAVGDGPIVGGVGYLVVYLGLEATSISIIGSAWEHEGAVSAAPAVAFDGTQTPVLYVEGGVMDEFDMLSRLPELRITVKNLSTGASLDTVLGTERSETAYSATFVELSRHAAKVGDVIEIVAHTANPYVGVRAVPQVVVSAEDVLTSRMKLPDLELYEIPSETELLANYPNPFNPETWIPYRLAKAAEVTLAIYDATGRLVRSIDVGFKPVAVYESRASAIYWDGRNDNGELVASGLYFYQLATPSYRQLRRMVILK